MKHEECNDPIHEQTNHNMNANYLGVQKRNVKLLRYITVVKLLRYITVDPIG